MRLSPNGKQMFYCQQLLDGNELKESRIYMSTDKGGTWSAGKELTGINIEGTLSKSPAAGELFGKKVLFFASTRDGGEGGWDLCVCEIAWGWGRGAGSMLVLKSMVQPLFQEMQNTSAEQYYLVQQHSFPLPHAPCQPTVVSHSHDAFKKH